MQSKKNVLIESPLDSSPTTPGNLVHIQPLRKEAQWVPSRYNALASNNDGSTIIWNTLSGAINVFKPEQKPILDDFLNNEHSGELSGLAKYLSDRGFIVAKEVDEYRQYQLAFGEQHYRTDYLELILLASEDCNFRCTYCYEDFPRGTMLPSVRESIKKLLLKRARSLHRLSIGWFGGEPLYGFKAIEDLAPFFMGLASDYSLDYSSHITTNAFLLTPDIAGKLLAWNISRYQITIDGLPEQHNRKRPTREGGETFQTILANLRALKDRRDNYSVRIRVNYDRENLPYIEGLLTLIQGEFGGDERYRVAFHPVGKWGGPNDKELTVCGIHEGFQSKLQLQKSANSKGLNVAGTLRELTGLGSNACYAARPYNFIVGADGKLMKCTVALDKEEHNVVGRLSDDGEFLLDRDKYARWVEPAFEGDAACRNCILLPTCQGVSCPLIRIEDKHRPCTATPKPNLKNELLAMPEMHKKKVHLKRV